MNWNTIFETTISGITVGIVLGGLGYLIWKKQQIYSKKLIVYNEFVPLLYSFRDNIIKTIESPDLNIDYAFGDFTMDSFIHSALNYTFYFGNEKIQNIKLIIDLLYEIVGRRCNKTDDEIIKLLDVNFDKIVDVKIEGSSMKNIISLFKGIKLTY